MCVYANLWENWYVPKRNFKSSFLLYIFFNAGWRRDFFMIFQCNCFQFGWCDEKTSSFSLYCAVKTFSEYFVRYIAPQRWCFTVGAYFKMEYTSNQNHYLKRTVFKRFQFTRLKVWVGLWPGLNFKWMKCMLRISIEQSFRNGNFHWVDQLINSRLPFNFQWMGISYSGWNGVGEFNDLWVSDSTESADLKFDKITNYRNLMTENLKFGINKIEFSVQSHHFQLYCFRTWWFNQTRINYSTNDSCVWFTDFIRHTDLASEFEQIWFINGFHIFQLWDFFILNWKLSANLAI